MTHSDDPITHHAYIAVDSIPPGVDLVAEVRALNSAGVEIPWVWQVSEKRFELRSTTQRVLVFGVHNEVGILEWEDGERSFVPTSGTGTQWQSYYLAGFHETGIPPHAEVPIDTVYTALAEFIATGARPTCVDWQEAASPMSEFE